MSSIKASQSKSSKAAGCCKGTQKVDFLARVFMSQFSAMSSRRLG